jgi:predicted ATPase
MPALRRLSVRNFRSMRTSDVPLGPVNVLVGPNGSGKSNFLDIIQFLRDCVRDDLQPAIEKRGGINRVRFRGGSAGQGHSFEINVEATVTGNSSATAPDRYHLEVGSYRRGEQPLLRREESFTFKRYAGRGRRVTISGSEFQIANLSKSGETENEKKFGLRADSLGLATLPKLTPDEGGDEVRRMAELFATFRVFNIDVAAARRPAAEGATVALRDDASNLAAFLHRLSSDTGSFDRFQEDARSLVPGLVEIHFRSIGGPEEAVAVSLKEKGLRDATSLADASFGSIRVLALLALLYDPSPPQLTCIEEIDHGLHPYVFDRLTELLREASTKTQFIIATHSPAFVNRLSASELIVCERADDGSSRIPAVSAERVQAIESAAGPDLRLGELWFSGTLSDQYG